MRSAFDCAAALLAAGADPDALAHGSEAPTTIVGSAGLHQSSPLATRLYAVLLRGGARLDDHMHECINSKIKREHGTWSSYIDEVYDAGGWTRYAQAHRKRLADMFASKLLRLPADVIPLVVDFWAHVGMSLPPPPPPPHARFIEDIFGDEWMLLWGDEARSVEELRAACATR